jgi:CO/xanthine dehydrogenase Mo-binding subunit
MIAHEPALQFGKPTALVDSNAKVTGQAWYGDDVRLANEVIGKILRSPHHYAKIKSIDTSKVEALPGVLAVATGADSPHQFGVLPVTKDEHAMAVEKVRHVGDLVACVAAVDEATAMEALNLFEVEYEVLEPVFRPKEGPRRCGRTDSLARQVSLGSNKRAKACLPRVW